MESWQSYGEWQYQLLSGRDQLPPTLKEELQKRTANCNTPYEKIAAIYQYLASTTRYVSIQLGIGGLQPIAAADVNRTGFGDCKRTIQLYACHAYRTGYSIRLHRNQHY